MSGCIEAGTARIKDSKTCALDAIPISIVEKMWFVSHNSRSGI